MEFIKVITAGTCTYLSFLFGGFDLSIQILATLLLLDLATGLIKAFLDKKLNSHTGWKGTSKKFLILIVIIVATQLDKLIGGTPVFRTLVIYYYCATEGISILENSAQVGIPLPRKLLEALEKLKGVN